MQFISNAVTFVFGFVINFIRDFPPFQPLASVGGLLFTTGIGNKNEMKTFKI